MVTRTLLSQISIRITQLALYPKTKLSPQMIDRLQPDVSSTTVLDHSHRVPPDSPAMYTTMPGTGLLSLTERINYADAGLKAMVIER
jgi:hypothetical protein